MTTKQKSEAKQLWDDGELTAQQIADHFGVTKNVIVGIANREE
jgi:GTP-sensing pleiotropic transcriptional regulator CodY